MDPNISFNEAKIKDPYILQASAKTLHRNNKVTRRLVIATPMLQLWYRIVGTIFQDEMLDNSVMVSHRWNCFQDEVFDNSADISIEGAVPSLCSCL